MAGASFPSRCAARPPRHLSWTCPLPVLDDKMQDNVDDADRKNESYRHLHEYGDAHAQCCARAVNLHAPELHAPLRIGLSACSLGRRLVAPLMPYDVLDPEDAEAHERSEPQEGRF